MAVNTLVKVIDNREQSQSIPHIYTFVYMYICIHTHTHIYIYIYTYHFFNVVYVSRHFCDGKIIMNYQHNMNMWKQINTDQVLGLYQES